jgi:hypothetical protein
MPVFVEESSPRAEVGYVHCAEILKHLYGGTDYQCECGMVFEIYGGLVVDGGTGRELPAGTIKEVPLMMSRSFRPGFSLNEKRRAVDEAEKYGLRVTARNFGVPESTLWYWQKTTGLIRNDSAQGVQHADRAV